MDRGLLALTSASRHDLHRRDPRGELPAVAFPHGSRVLAASVHESPGGRGVDSSVVDSDFLQEDDRWPRKRLAVTRASWRG
jgi:hypothetical protein